MRKHIRSSLVSVVGFGIAVIATAYLWAEGHACPRRNSTLDNTGFLRRNDEDDAKQIQLYLADSTRATKEYLGYTYLTMP